MNSPDLPVNSGGLRPLANESTTSLDRLRAVERERDSLARRCAARYEETERLRAEIATLRATLAKLTAAENPDRCNAEGDDGRRCQRGPHRIRDLHGAYDDESGWLVRW